MLLEVDLLEGPSYTPQLQGWVHKASPLEKEMKQSTSCDLSNDTFWYGSWDVVRSLASAISCSNSLDCSLYVCLKPSLHWSNGPVFGFFQFRLNFGDLHDWAPHLNNNNVHIVTSGGRPCLEPLFFIFTPLGKENFLKKYIVLNCEFPPAVLKQYNPDGFSHCSGN